MKWSYHCLYMCVSVCVCPNSCTMHDLYIKPLPDEKILDWSKLKEIADDILKCIESEK